LILQGLLQAREANTLLIDDSRHSRSSDFGHELGSQWKQFTNPSARVGDADRHFTAPVIKIVSPWFAIASELDAESCDQGACRCQTVLAVPRADE
jgi:hypothetical protein